MYNLEYIGFFRKCNFKTERHTDTHTDKVIHKKVLMRFGFVKKQTTPTHAQKLILQSSNKLKTHIVEIKQF